MKEYRKEENEKETYSVEQVIQFTMDILNGIMIPAGLSESVGIPISKAIGNLGVLMEAAKNMKPNEEKEVKKDGREADLK